MPLPRATSTHRNKDVTMANPQWPPERRMIRSVLDTVEPAG
jgi:hypothetical protein